MTRRRGRDEAGFVTAWTVGAAFACVSMIGLAYEGGAALRERSNAFGAASAAARAGTQALDEGHAVEHGEVRLDTAEAQRRAREHLDAWGVDATSGSVVVNNDEPEGPEVTVTVSGGAPFQVIPGSHGFTVSATARTQQVGD